MTQELHGVISLGGTVIGGSLYQRGLKGETGVGIESVVMTAGYDLIITYTDESVETVPTGLDTYKALLEGYKSETYSYMQGAVNSASSAYSSAQSASGSASDAATYRGQAYNYATSAQTSATNASLSATAAGTAKTAAETAQGLAETAQGKAETAQGKAETAQGKAEDAQLSAEGFSMLAEEASLMSLTYQLKSEGYAVGEQDGEPVGDTSPYYENNSKYYSEQSADSAEDADASALVSEGYANGEQNGTPVTSGSPYYHNNAKYYSEQFIRAFPTDTASGAIASFEDGSDLFDYLSCVVEINPVQAGSGTPSPQNVRPITGWTGCEVDVSGVNLFDKTAVSVNKWLSTTTGLEESAYGYVVSDYIKVEANKPVFIPKSGTARRWLYDANKAPLTYLNNSSDQIYTPPVDGYIRITILTSGGGAVDINGYQVEYGSTASDYSAYNGTTYPVSWQTEAGTVYGGKLHIAIVNGEPKTWIVVDRAETTYDGSNDEVWVAGGNGRVYIQLNAMERMTDYIGSIDCDKLPTLKDHNVLSSQKGISGYVKDSSYPNQNWLYVAIEGASAVADLRTWLGTNPIQVVYPLATPTTYQLDPVQVACLLGQNNVWADCGDIEEVQYKADVQKWVEKQLREINTAILALS